MAFLDPGSDAGIDNDTEQAQPDTEQHQKLLRWAQATNIADELDTEKLGAIGQQVKREYDIDLRSREDWVDQYRRSMDLAMQVTQEKQYPWPKASNVIYPLITTSALQFAARAYPAIVDGRNVAKGVVIGPDVGQPLPGPDGNPVVDPQTRQPVMAVPPGAKRERANRIGEHMSWQLLDEMPEWEPETDKLLHLLPIAGCVFRKSYFDPGKGRNMALLVSALNVVINYHAKSMESAPRITEELQLYPLEINEMERAGLFRKITYTSAPTSDGDEDAPQDMLEQHRWLDLDDDGYPEPYIVTCTKDNAQVVRIRARFQAEDVHFDGKTHKVLRIEPMHYYTKYDFLPNPDGGIYGIGFGQLLRPLNEAINTSINLMIDSGHLAVTGGGFIGRGMNMNAGALRFQPGEYKMLNVPGSVVKDSVVPLQFPGPSNVLFQMLGLLIESGKEIAAIKDVLTGEQQQHNIPATTTLALIDQGLKVFTAIYKRVHRSLKDELNKLYKLNGIYLPQETSYRQGDDWKTIQRQDYLQGSGVEPVSDPTMVSDQQKLAKAQFMMQFMNDPMMNGLQIRKYILDAANIERADSYINAQPPPNPALMVKMSEMQIKGQREKAAELKDIAQALLFFAQADAVMGDQHLAWVQQQLEGWKAQFEMAQPQGGAEGVPAGPTAEPPSGPAPIPSMAHSGARHPPTGAPPSPLAPQGPSGAAPGAPPIQGAKQAPDGHWYIPDPARAGKFLMVRQ